jgi:hypothetical protein
LTLAWADVRRIILGSLMVARFAGGQSQEQAR